jgi:hypothetical protein
MTLMRGWLLFTRVSAVDRLLALTPGSGGSFGEAFLRFGEASRPLIPEVEG